MNLRASRGLARALLLPVRFLVSSLRLVRRVHPRAQLVRLHEFDHQIVPLGVQLRALGVEHGAEFLSFGVDAVFKPRRELLERVHAAPLEALVGRHPSSDDNSQIW